MFACVGMGLLWPERGLRDRVLGLESGEGPAFWLCQNPATGGWGGVGGLARC